jgi:uncharacterized protein YndB with AHSA1/START domain
MDTNQKILITVQVIVDASIAEVWEKWNDPADIMQWNTASADWHTTKSENDLRVGGNFVSRMEAKDGSFGFDFGGVYNKIITHELIEYTLGDERKVKILFSEENGKTKIVEIFEAEKINPVEIQQLGWQAILDNFKKYTESKF